MRTTFAAFRHPAFRLWAAADIVSVTGTWMQVLAINWYVLQATGSTTSMGLTVLLQALPTVLLSPLGGVLADRLRAKPLLVTTQLAHAVLAVALMLIAMAPTANLPALYAVATVGGIVAAIENPVMGRFASTIVDRETLGNAVSLGSVMNSTGRILGMALGGAIIAANGAGPLFAANAVSYLAVIAAILAIKPRALPVAEPLESAARHGLREGLVYLAAQPVILVVLGLAVVLGSLGRNYQITMAAMSDGPLLAGAAGYALLSTAFAVGTVLGGLLAASRTTMGLRLLIGLGLLTSVGQILSGLAPALWAMVAVIVPIAAGAVMIDTVVSTRVQLDTRTELRGRVLGVAAAASGIAGAVGAPLLGWLSEFIGPRGTLVLAGLVTAGACVAAGLAIARLRGVTVRPADVLRASLLRAS